MGSSSSQDMVKRKAEKQQPAAPVSAFAARKARQQQQQQSQQLQLQEDISHTVNKALELEQRGEPPSKKARRVSEENNPAQSAGGEESAPKRRSSRQNKNTESTAKTNKGTRGSNNKGRTPVQNEVQYEEEQDPSDVEEMDHVMGEDNDDTVASINGEADGYESPTQMPEIQNFPLSKARLNKNNIVYSDEHTLCVRIKEKMNLTLLGHYDMWVKRGVVSLMGAKLHPSPRVYRVYAPSTHSLPVIKCVSGVDGEAEIEVKSCQSGLFRLRDVSPLYQRIWNGANTTADKLTLKNAAKNHRRTFSVLYTSAEDSMKRHLRPLHMEKQWSSAIKQLSQRGGQLRALVCGPKASGKSTFSRYLLNHLLSPAPSTEGTYNTSDGVAFLDLDPGQPEFSPMGQVYLAHLRSPFFGPPFTHPALDNTADGYVHRAHHIGATSPKDDPDHYVLAATDLMDRYRSLLATYPQCPLIINYPGWIFGLGLEVASWLVKTLGLSDVVYMSEKGPTEVIEPLAQAAYEARVALTTLPSQPTDFVSRSSAQLRTMQIQSYFHQTQPETVRNPVWLETPTSRARPMLVDYADTAGRRQGIQGIMVLGSQLDPDLLHDVLDGSIVGIVAVESLSSYFSSSSSSSSFSSTAILDDHHREHQPDSPDHDLANEDASAEADDMHDGHDIMHEQNDVSPATAAATTTATRATEPYITRTARENLPYLFTGSGSCTPPDPKTSRCLGLALVRSINVSAQKLELVTPVPAAQIREALESGNTRHGGGIILVRGQLDNPNWAISEEYYAARAALQRYQRRVTQARKSKHESQSEPDSENQSETDDDNDPNPDLLNSTHQAQITDTLRDRLQRASQTPWMTVVEDDGRRRREAARRERSLWKLRKRAYPGSESET